ncbi:MAG: hypothetical protein Q7T44_18210 [Parvibaculum sp.]|nr:hypothetical protein [Parvibaculum sp.]
MITPVVFAFPSRNGYQFHPSDTGEKSDILAALTPSEDSWRGGISVAPFARASWVGHSSWLPKSKAIFIVGVTSRGIQNSVHRGGYSMWVAATIISRKKSFSGDEAMAIMKEVFEEFTEAAQSINKCQAFFEALGEYVIAPAGLDKLKSAVDELSVRITDKDIARNVSALPMLGRLRRVAAGIAPR